MLYRQRKTIETLRHVQVFLDEHDDRLHAINAGGARKALDDITDTLVGLAMKQDPIRFQRQSKIEEERRARFELRENQMKPIAKISALELPTIAEFARLRLPPKSAGSPTYLTWGREMAKAAELHAPMFLANGLAEGFISQLLAAVDKLQHANDQRCSMHASRIGATERIRTETRRAMRVIGVIDALVVRELADDGQLAREWQATRLVARRRTTAAALEATAAAPRLESPVATAAPALDTPRLVLLASPAEPTASELVITSRLRKVLVLAWETRIARLVRRDAVEPAEGEGG